MTTPETNARLRVALDHLLGEFDRIQQSAARTRAELGKVDGHAESRNGTVKVTVGPRGNLTALEISQRAYQKMSPSVLSAEIVRLTDEAARQAADRAATLLAPLLPPGVSTGDLVDGKVDLSALVPEQALAGTPFDQWWSRIGRGGTS